MQIINANLELVSRSTEPAADEQALEENRRMVKQLDLAASLRTWLALQGHVNSLLDSTTAGPGAKADVQVGLDPTPLDLQPAMKMCELPGIHIAARLAPVPHEILCGTHEDIFPARDVPEMAEMDVMQYFFSQEASLLQRNCKCGEWEWYLIMLGHVAGAGNKAAAGEEGGPVPQEHDGQACQLCGALGHLPRPIPGSGGDRGSPLLCRAPVLPRACHPLERGGLSPPLWHVCTGGPDEVVPSISIGSRNGSILLPGCYSVKGGCLVVVNEASYWW